MVDVRRQDLEHIIRAAGAIAEDNEIVVIGSQAILATFPDAPEELLQSSEADIFPLHHPERADLIDGAMGEFTMFHDTFGYYAQGVGPATAVAPEGWEQRFVSLVNANTEGITGRCLEVHDLFLAKLRAMRPKDIRYCRGMVATGLVDHDLLRDRVALMPVDAEIKQLLSELLEGMLHPATTEN